MLITNISATAFRNLEIESQEFSPKINILHGMNAQGKTNCLESIYFCAFGRPMRSNMDCDLVGFNEKAAHVRVDVQKNLANFRIDAHIERYKNKSAKSLSIDRIPIKHMKELFGLLLVVMFSPEDLSLIKAGPSERRRFMDIEICQLSPVYYGDLREYFRALKQRNALLKTLQKDRSQMDSLSIWDEQLIYYGARIIKTRSGFVNRINNIAREIHFKITQNKENLQLIYAPNISDDYSEVMSKSHERDIIRGSTSNGIHKDDIVFTVNGISARNFGSQGQQRTAALSAKLAEIEIIKSSALETPILLLDDVLSELDKFRQQFLLTQIEGIQTLITCTGVEDVLMAKTIGEYKTIKVENGRLL